MSRQLVYWFKIRGRALFDIANARRAHSGFEMSSVNPVFVLPGMETAEIDGFTTGLMGSTTLGLDNFVRIQVYSIPGGEFGEQFKVLLH